MAYHNLPETVEPGAVKQVSPFGHELRNKGLEKRARIKSAV